MTDAIKSIPEGDASGATAALYADIRRTLRVPAVNLVWRHLAACDGALDWVWPCLRPLYDDPRLADAAAGLRDRCGALSIVLPDRAGLEAAGLAAPAIHDIRRVLANYDDSNPLNLVALLSLLHAVRRTGGSSAAASVVRAPPLSRDLRADNALPPLIPETAMAPAVRAEARRLEALASDRTTGPVVAGVPRHLAHWPVFLHAACDAIAAAEPAVRTLMCITVHTRAGANSRHCCWCRPRNRRRQCRARLNALRVAI